MEGFYLSFYSSMLTNQGECLCTTVMSVRLKMWPDFVHGLYLLCIYFVYGMIGALSYDWCF